MGGRDVTFSADTPGSHFLLRGSRANAFPAFCAGIDLWQRADGISICGDRQSWPRGTGVDDCLESFGAGAVVVDGQPIPALKYPVLSRRGDASIFRCANRDHQHRNRASAWEHP